MSNNKFNIAIVDDEKAIRDLYSNYVSIWGANNRLKINIKTFKSGEEFIFNYYDYKDFDIILLDIEMKNLSGVELAKKLRNLNDNVQIIFISGYSEYIGEGYEVDALHFLIKPIDKNKLFDTLDKAVKTRDKLEQFIIVKFDGEQIKLYLKDIYSITNDKNYIVISTFNENYKIRMTLKEMENKLDNRFFRINRSDIVNIEYINSISKNELQLDNNIKYLISRGKYEEINRKLIEYY